MSVPAPGSPASSAIRSPRGRRGTSATVTALIGVLVFAAGATEAISLAMHRRTVGFDVSRVTRFARTTDLADSSVLVVAIVAFVVGVALLVAAALPARRRLVELTESDPSVAAGLTPRSLRRTLAAAAVAVDGVSDAKVSGRRRVTVTATTTFRDVEALPDRISERVTARLTELDPITTRTVRVVLRRKDA